jgi:hypothetical protein
MKSRKTRLVMLVVTVVMYIIAAGAPACVGIISG